MKYIKSLEEVIKARRSVRRFKSDLMPKEVIQKIVTSALYAPSGGEPYTEPRKIYVLSQNSDILNLAKQLLVTKIKKNSKALSILLFVLPFLKPKMQAFSNKLRIMAEVGIPSLEVAPYFIVIAQKKVFPPVAQLSLSHAMQNIWLSATNEDLGFQMISATNLLSNNLELLDLLGLEKNRYELGGCVLGYSDEDTKAPKNLDDSSSIYWV